MYLRKMFYIGLMLCLTALYAFANHSTLRNDSFNPLPDAQTSGFRSDSRIFWGHEQAQRDGEAFAPFVVSGGTHPTSVSLTSIAFATVARVPERISQVVTAITYTGIANGTCFTIISSQNAGIAGWTRVGTTAYYFQCNATNARPTLPANSTWLMQITQNVAGTALLIVDTSIARQNPLTATPVFSPRLCGATSGGVVDAAAALLDCMTQAATLGVVLDLEGLTYAVASELVIPASNLTVRNGTILASVLVADPSAGGSSVVSGVGRSNITFEDVVFNANGNRRWGLSLDITTTNIRLTRVDALYYTDRFNTGFNIPSNAVVSLRPTPIIQRTNYTNITAQSTGGSLPAGTFAIYVTATDALGREGPFFLVGTSGISRVLTGATSTLNIVWNANANARSYRVYIGQTSVGWERYYVVPVLPTLPATYSYTVTGLWATVQPSLLTATTGAGTFTGELYQDYFFRVAAEFGTGRNNYSAVIPSQITAINNSSTVVTLTWAAPSGASPDSYLIMVARPNTGGLNNFFEAIRINPAVLSFVYTGQVGVLMHPWGNSDQVPAEGYNIRPYGGSGIELTAGSRQQANERPGYDVDYQFASIQNSTGTDPASSSFTGNAFSIAKVADTLKLWWRVGVFGNSDDYWFSHRDGSVQQVAGLKRGIGLIRPGQSMASVYVSTTTGSLWGDGTTRTVPFDTRQVDNLGNWDTVGFQFIVPTIPVAVTTVNARVAGVVSLFAAAGLNANGTAQIRIRRGADGWNTNYTNLGDGAATTTVSLIIPETVFAVATGEAIYVQLIVNNGGLNTGVHATASRETRLVVTME